MIDFAGRIGRAVGVDDRLAEGAGAAVVRIDDGERRQQAAALELLRRCQDEAGGYVAFVRIRYLMIDVRGRRTFRSRLPAGIDRSADPGTCYLTDPHRKMTPPGGFSEIGTSRTRPGPITSVREEGANARRRNCSYFANGLSGNARSIKSRWKSGRDRSRSRSGSPANSSTDRDSPPRPPRTGRPWPDRGGARPLRVARGSSRRARRRSNAATRPCRQATLKWSMAVLFGRRSCWTRACS